MKSNSREYIIEKTAQLFNRLGAQGTSLAAICEATGLTKGAIYANFRDKNELAVAVFEYNVNRLIRIEHDLIRVKDSPHEQILLLLDFYRNAFLYEEFRYGCPLANLAPEADDTNELLLQAVQKAIRGMTEFYRQLIQKGKNRGEYKGEADPDFAYTIVSMLEGALLVTKTSGDRRYLDGICGLIQEKVTGWRKATAVVN